MHFQKILVTGCGGDIGLGVGRILKEAGVAGMVVGCDITDDHAGRVFFDACFCVPRADDPSYADVLFVLVAREGIDLVIPMSEPELRLLAAHAFFGRRDLFLTASEEAMAVGFDKYRTAEFLRTHGLPHPWTACASDGAPRVFPCIRKSRTGCGSKSVEVLTEAAYHAAIRTKGTAAFSEDDIFQEYLPDAEEEYTCGLFRSRAGETRSIVLRRKLRGDVTGSGEVAEDAAIMKLLAAIADGLQLAGSINVQLRRRAGIPYVFEINPRFSSTVMFRHRLGFSDVLWSLQDRAGEPLGAYVPPAVGTRFYKIYEDVIDRRNQMNNMNGQNSIRGGADALRRLLPEQGIWTAARPSCAA